MSKNVKTFLVVLLINFLSWWGLNLLHVNLENLFYWQEINLNPEMFLAQVNIEPKIERVLAQEEFQQKLQLELESESAISVFIAPDGEEKIIFEKNTSLERPIASLTKLMTALISLNKYGSEKTFVISQRAVNQEGEKGNLKAGERLYLKDLLHVMLVESSNDAAWAIAEGKENFVLSDSKNIALQTEDKNATSEINTEHQNEEIFPLEKNYLDFIELMNSEARRLGMKNTYFLNPTGLDGFENYSTAQDLVNLIKYIIEEKPQIFEITRKQSYEALNADGSFHHFIAENTNKLLSELPNIIGGKTGYTDEAGGCMVLVLEKEGGGYFLNVILGTVTAEARFQDMKKITDHLKTL